MENVFDKEFCNRLENEIDKYLEKNTQKNTKGFWCDGVLFDYKLTNEIICFKAFVGKDGNTEYKLSLKIGEAASSTNEISIISFHIDADGKSINMELK